MNTSDSWTVRDVPANQHRLTLTKLDPGSLYEVEMATYNCAGEGQTAMVTFRTGKDCILFPNKRNGNGNGEKQEWGHG